MGRTVSACSCSTLGRIDCSTPCPNYGPTETRIEDVMAQIAALGEGTPEYHEAMWMLLSVMARRQAIIADQLRRARASREAREAARAARQADRACTDPACTIEPPHGSHDFRAGAP